MIKTEGRKEPNKYILEMGLAMRAWTAGGIIEHLKEMPRDTILVNVKYREQFNEITLYFEEALNTEV